MRSSEPVELPVYTSIFRLQRRLYRVYDIELPVPVSFPQLAAFAAAALAITTVLQVLGVGFTPGSAWAYLVPPGVAAWWANRPVADGRPPLAWLGAQVRHLLEPRTLVALEPWRGHPTLALAVKVRERAPSAPERRSDAVIDLRPRRPQQCR